jgi:hypothetical protein
MRIGRCWRGAYMRCCLEGQDIYEDDLEPRKRYWSEIDAELEHVFMHLNKAHLQH